MENTKQTLTTIWDKIAGNKLLLYMLYLIVAVLIAVIYFTGTSSDSKNITTAQIEKNPVSDDLKTLLEHGLGSISGVGKVEVMITYSTSGELVPAMNVDQTQTQNGDSNSQSTSTRPLTIDQSGKNAPVVLMQKQPEIRGAVIVAQGARDIGVKVNLINAATTLLGLKADKVQVFEMKSVE